MVLHITNGDILAERLSRIGMAGMILPWREVLHEGPLPLFEEFTSDSVAEWNGIRADFIAECGWGVRDDVFFEMNQRDTLLLDNRWPEIILWFERDLYDQMSLAHISRLMLGHNTFPDPGVTLVVTDTHFTNINDDDLKKRFERRTPFDTHSATQYAEFFDSCCGPDPAPMASTVAPMALVDAAVQFAKLLPGEGGLSEFDHRMLEIIKREGQIDVSELFVKVQVEDGDDFFWGDTSFTRRLKMLAQQSSNVDLRDGVLFWKD